MAENSEKRVSYPSDDPDIVKSDIMEVIAYEYSGRRDIDIVIQQR